MKRAILVLRPEPGNAKTCARAQELGLNAIPMPLFKVEPLDWEAPEPNTFSGILMTSANAARWGGTQLAHFHHLPLFAVGEATAGAAREAGFEPEMVGKNDVESILEIIAAQGHRKILHLCGTNVTSFTSDMVRIEQRHVYHSLAIEPQLDWQSLLANGPIVLVHSARAGTRLADLVAQSGVCLPSIALVAISETAARATGDGWQSIAIAANPRDEAVLAIAHQLAQTTRLPKQEVRNDGC
jgi:uroporphyrinogen-III synthase